MDRVDLPQGIESFFNPNAGSSALKGTGTRKPKGKAAVGNEFSNVLERSILETAELGPLTELNPSEEAVQQLLETVQSTGNDLKHRPFPEEIINYKKAVRDFLHYVVENSYSLEYTQTVGRKRKELPPHLQIRIIDQKLEEMAAGILTRQINQLELASKLDEITGLLIDLTVTGKISLDK